MGLQSQVNSLIGSVSGAIAGTANVLSPASSPIDAKAIDQTQQRLEKEKLARAKQKAAMEKQRAMFLESKARKLKAQENIRNLKDSKNSISIGGEKITDPNLIKKLKERMNG